MIALAVLPAFTSPEAPILPEALLIALVFALASMPCPPGWAWLGKAAGALLGLGLKLRIFNCVMAALMVLSLVPPLTP